MSFQTLAQRMWPTNHPMVMSAVVIKSTPMVAATERGSGHPRPKAAA